MNLKVFYKVVMGWVSKNFSFSENKMHVPKERAPA